MKFRILLLHPVVESLDIDDALLFVLAALRNMVYIRNVDEKNDIDPVIIGIINNVRFCATLKLGMIIAAGEVLLLMMKLLKLMADSPVI